MHTLDYKKYADKIREAVAESVVLLKNDNQTLPICKDEKVAIFGRAQIDTYYCGTGSGGMVNIPYLVNFAEGISAKRTIDNELHKAYLDFVEENPFDKGTGWAQEPFSQKEMPLTVEMVERTSRENAIALVVIGRSAGEDKDVAPEGGSYYLSEVEKANLKLICEKFERVAVALNVGAVMDMQDIIECNPSAILYTWHGGVECGNGYADVICGDVNPSGVLPNTIACTLEDYPSSKNFGSETANIYAEDIYVGYRYFETFAPEKVLFPFGFGLSYSTFEVSNTSCNFDEKTASYNINTTVTNTGTLSGKKSVQIYVQAPIGKLGKSKVSLIGFAKTDLLSPSQAQTLSINVSKRELSSFDDSISAFVMEAGEYNLQVGFDCRNISTFASFTLEKDEIIEKTADALKPIVEFEKLTSTMENGEYKATYAPALTREYSIAERISQSIKSQPQKTENGYTYKDLLDGKISAEELANDLSNLELIQMTRGEGMCSPKVTAGTAGCFGGVTEALKETRKMPIACCSDGPSGIRMDCGTMAFSLPNATALASTMNVKLIQELFEFLSLEMLHHKVDTLLGPGMNIHRSPLCGRNFEYYSEDPFLTGKLAVEQLLVMNKHGITGTIKHYVANNQEKARKVVDSIVSARALREIYLRAFEMAVREGNAYSIMTAYNPINGTQAASNFDLNTTILREDWGFDGIVMTDWWATMNKEGGDSSIKHTADMITSQNDVYMVTGSSQDNQLDDNSEAECENGNLSRFALVRGAVNIINTLKRFNCTNGVPEIKIKNLPENKNQTAFSHGTFAVVNEIEIDCTAFDTSKKTLHKMILALSEFGKYQIEFDLFGDAVELAQIPMSVSINGGLIKTITLKGGTKGVYTCEFDMFATINTYLELFFGEAGMVINRMTVKRINKGEQYMSVTGSFVTIDNTEYYKISDSKKLAPFFIQVASASDIWIFMSSNGGVTAGRKNSDGNLFPYTTNDKLDFDCHTGSKTIIKLGKKYWQPFCSALVEQYKITRNIYKSYYANSIIMEEINHDLAISYSYKYESSEKFGFVKTSKITSLSGNEMEIEVVDGLNNIMPYGVNARLQMESSTLVDAYKANELLGDRLAIYSLTTTINDCPHPIEMTRANIAYHTAPFGTVYLDPVILNQFVTGETRDISAECYGKKGGYFVTYTATIKPEKALTYSFVLDNGYDHSQIAKIEKIVSSGDFSALFADIEQGTKDILKIVTEADGIQSSGDKVATATHYLSTLYNVMRGGTFERGYEFDYDIFMKFITKRNKKATQNKALLAKIKNCKTVQELKEVAKEDDVLYRLALEFMPLSFSRRHGDPSRPWNKFNIALKDENGEKTVNYEGNWRDIFQNWEALGLSFPYYYENMVAKFVNASTVDGFNPYRINNDGIDWEKPEEDNPFGGLGYWGDHQIVYLLRLLQGLSSHYPSSLAHMLTDEVFSYANVPYIIKDYSEILKDSKNTLIFDVEKDEALEQKTLEYGTDAKLLLKDEEVYTVSLAEKLLVPVLSKISNLLPGGGIWMNTQRPEWNDANNAIVGIGLSVITVYHTKAYLEFIRKLFTTQGNAFSFSAEVVEWLEGIKNTLTSHNSAYKGNEKAILDSMGNVFNDYRNKVYANGFSAKSLISSSEILAFIDEAISLVDYTIEQNSGDVYVSYNLLKDDFSVEAMKPMLEGQSAIVSSGSLSADEVCSLINSMKNSLYCTDEKYHTLYPINKTARFFDKNIVSEKIGIVDGITERAINGKLHFNAQIVSEEVLRNKCCIFGISSEVTNALLTEFERIFAHKSFNGRSEVMYKFEGIGCVYWHQNAKFALAVLETAQRACKNGEDFAKIYEAYNELLQGFIYRKSPKECGAIPIEPYSHTSFNKKSEQPGMTGQVKESVIMRRGELGVTVADGMISFNSEFLREDEFDENAEIKFSCYSVQCVYKKSDKRGISVFNNGVETTIDGYTLNNKLSKCIFRRTGEISSIVIYIQHH